MYIPDSRYFRDQYKTTNAIYGGTLPKIVCNDNSAPPLILELPGKMYATRITDYLMR